jgi:hypothetical protein
LVDPGAHVFGAGVFVSFGRRGKFSPIMVIFCIWGRVPLTCCVLLGSRAGFADIKSRRGNSINGTLAFGGTGHLEWFFFFFWRYNMCLGG